MYKDYFGFVELPFSIVPSAHYLFLSQRHQEAITLLQAGLGDGGGFALLTGEVGTGKTTVAKMMLSQLAQEISVGLILNPTFSSSDLLEAICDQFKITYPEQASLKQLSQAIYRYLLEQESKGIQTLLMIDEAQHLSPDVLEQLRLLTNLEVGTFEPITPVDQDPFDNDDHHLASIKPKSIIATTGERNSRKLLKVLLIGQPELQAKLQTTQLRQLAQRITGRYHLLPLTDKETEQYIHFRLNKAGGKEGLFSPKSIKLIAKQTGGVPRLINLVCDQALLLTYKGNDKSHVEMSFLHNAFSEAVLSDNIVKKACLDVMSFQIASSVRPSQISIDKKFFIYPLAGVVIAASVAGGYYGWQRYQPHFSAYLDSLSQPVASTSSKVISMPATKTNPDDEIPIMLQKLLLKQESQSDAIRVLYNWLGYQASDEPLCQPQNGYLFQCEAFAGTFDTLIADNYPVVLKLQWQDSITYATLISFSDDSAQLLIAGKNIEIPSLWLATIWTGDYYLLWQNPFAPMLRAGHRGSQVVVLRKRLSQALNDPELLSNHYDLELFDQQLKLRVEQFQQQQDMAMDGIAGVQTLKRLAILTMPEMKILTKPTTVALNRSELVDAKTVNGSAKSNTLTSSALIEHPYPDFSVLKPLPTVNIDMPYFPPVGDATVTKPNSVKVTPDAIKMGTMTKEEALQLDDIDLSKLSPELALLVQGALNTNQTQSTLPKVEQDTQQQPSTQTDTNTAIAKRSYAKAVSLDENRERFRLRLPAMNLQTHMYASVATRRWVMINNKEFAEGGWITPKVQLLAIEPQSIVVSYEGETVRIPALYEWKG